MEHHFKVEEAQVYGIEEAIILYNLRFWLKHNQANKSNIKKGEDGNYYYWTYNSGTAFAALFPYMGKRTIQRKLQNLVKNGLIMTGDFNKNRYDRTYWYTIPSEFLAYLSTDPNCPMDETECPMDAPECPIDGTNSVHQNDSLYPPIPDNKPDKNPDKKNTHVSPGCPTGSAGGDAQDPSLGEAPKKKAGKDGTISEGYAPSVVVSGKKREKANDHTVEENRQINELIQLFYGINPTVSFVRVHNRRGAWELIKHQGFEPAMQLAMYAIMVQGRPYSPVITTPADLYDKFAKLKVYLSREFPNWEKERQEKEWQDKFQRQMEEMRARARKDPQ